MTDTNTKILALLDDARVMLADLPRETRVESYTDYPILRKRSVTLVLGNGAEITVSVTDPAHLEAVEKKVSCL